MSKNKYRISEAAGFLYRLGVNFWETGTIDKGGQKMFDYYKGDEITEEQLKAVKEWCPHATTFGSQSQYAPEQKSRIIAFPKAAYFRELKASKSA